jgi:hypothetical protein
MLFITARLFWQTPGLAFVEPDRHTLATLSPERHRFLIMVPSQKWWKFGVV